MKAAEVLGGPMLSLPQPWMPLPAARLLPAHPARDQRTHHSECNSAPVRVVPTTLHCESHP